MPTALDNFLNFIIPILVVVAMLWILYKPFKKPIDALGKWIKKIISGEGEAEQLVTGGYLQQSIYPKRDIDFE